MLKSQARVPPETSIASLEVEEMVLTAIETVVANNFNNNNNAFNENNSNEPKYPPAVSSNLHS